VAWLRLGPLQAFGPLNPLRAYNFLAPFLTRQRIGVSELLVLVLAL
jgi:hypothetical protein